MGIQYFRDKVLGKIELDVNIGDCYTRQKFLVIDKIGRNAILGHDWLAANKVHLYFDSLEMKVQNTIP